MGVERYPCLLKKYHPLTGIYGFKGNILPTSITIIVNLQNDVKGFTKKKFFFFGSTCGVR